MIILSLFNFFKQTPESGIIKVEGFGSNPGNLTMYQYIPEGLEKDAALVVVLHGCAQSADSIAVQSDWNKLADEHKFMVIYPQQKITNNIKKCFNWFQNNDIQKDKGETASIKQMIDFAIAENGFDPSRVFITGISAGGAMASVMMANYPNAFKAGAVMAGIPFGAANSMMEGLNAMKGEVIKPAEVWADSIKKQNPEYTGKYPKLAVFQGIDDPYVNIANADEQIKQYTALHHLGSIANITNDFDNNPDVTLYKYQNTEKETPVLYYKIDNLGHAIAIDPGEGSKQGGKLAQFAVDKGFHSTYWAADFFGLIDN